MKQVFIDTDIFVRDLRYQRDANIVSNQKFLDKVRSRKIKGVTSIFNLLEVCGVLSFNLSQDDLLKLYADFTKYYSVQILFPANAQVELQYDIPKIFQSITQKQGLGDAQISYVINRFATDLSFVATWNIAHYEGRVSVPVLTPDQIS